MRLISTLLVAGMLCVLIPACSHSPLSDHRTRKKVRAMRGLSSSFVEDPGGKYTDVGSYWGPVNRIEIGPCYWAPRVIDVEELKAVLRRTPRLQRLGLTFMDISDADLVEILDGLPNLRIIHLTGTGAGAGVVDHLADHLVRGPAKIDLDATCASPEDIARLRRIHSEWEISWSPACGEQLKEIQALAKVAYIIEFEAPTNSLPTNCVIDELFFDLRPEGVSTFRRLPEFQTPIRAFNLWGSEVNRELDTFERLDRVEHLILGEVDHLSWLSEMKGLKSLTFRGSLAPSNLEGTDWSGLANLPPNLTELSFSNCVLPDDAFAHLKPEGPLRSVTFNYMHISTHNLQTLARVKQLERFRAFQCWMGDAAFAALIHPNGFVHLVLEARGVTDSGLEALAGASRLEHLTLHESRVTDAGLPALLKAPNLETAILRGGSAVTSEGLEAFLAGSQSEMDITLE